MTHTLDWDHFQIKINFYIQCVFKRRYRQPKCLRLDSLRGPVTLTLYRQLDFHAVGVPAGVLHYGPSHAGVVASMLPRHFLYHQLVPARMEEGGGLHLRPVEEPGVGEVRAHSPAAQREAWTLVGNRGEGFRGHPGVLRRSWEKNSNI